MKMHVSASMYNSIILGIVGPVVEYRREATRSDVLPGEDRPTLVWYENWTGHPESRPQ